MKANLQMNVGIHDCALFVNILFARIVMIFATAIRFHALQTDDGQ